MQYSFNFNSLQLESSQDEYNRLAKDCTNGANGINSEQRSEIQQLDEFTSRMIKDHISAFTLKFKDTEIENKVIQLVPTQKNRTQIFIFQRHALQSNPKQPKKVGCRLWGTGELSPQSSS